MSSNCPKPQTMNQNNYSWRIAFLTLLVIFQVKVFAAGERPSASNTNAKQTYKLVEVGKQQWDDLKEFSEGLAGVSLDGQWGFIETNGNIAVNLQRDWKYAFPFQDGLAQVDVGGGNYDFVARTGQTLVSSRQRGSEAEAVWPRVLMTSSDRHLTFSYGLIPVGSKLGKWGFMNKAGRLVVPPKWDGVMDFHEGLARVKIYDSARHSRTGFIDTNGLIAIPLQWDDAISFSEGLAMVISNGLCGFIKHTGEVAIAPEWDSCESFHGGFALASKQFRFGVIDQNGRTVIQPEFTGFELANPILVLRERKFGVIDKTGNIAGGLWWDSVKYPLSTMAGGSRDSAEFWPNPGKDYSLRVERDGKWGLIDNNGSIVVQPMWEEVDFFESNLASVKQDGKWGLIDRTGKLVIKPQWEAVRSQLLAENIVAAKQSGKWGLFDITGKAVAQPQWDELSSFSEGLSAARLNDKWGLIDYTGRTICPPKWDWTEPPHDGLMRVRDGKKWRLFQVIKN